MTLEVIVTKMKEGKWATHRFVAIPVTIKGNYILDEMGLKLPLDQWLQNMKQPIYARGWKIIE